MPAAGQVSDETYALLVDGTRHHGCMLAVCLGIMRDDTAEIAGEIGFFYDRYPAVAPRFTELYALALARAGRPAEARSVAARPAVVRRDKWWLFWTVARGLLAIAIAIAIDDLARAETAYEALLPYACPPGRGRDWRAAPLAGRPGPR